MPLLHPLLAVLLLLGLLATDLRAQQLAPDAFPPPLVPLRKPTQKDLDHREAVKQYVIGLMHQRDDRFVKALEAYEKAAKLDPEAVPVYKALIPLYLALSRSDEALAACKKAVELDPNDYETWYVHARQLRDLARPAEAIAALNHAIACPGLKDKPGIQLQMNYDLAQLHEETKDFRRAVTAYQAVGRILIDKREMLVELGPVTGEMLDLEEAKTHERIGQVCIQAKQTREAIDAFLKAQDIIQNKVKDASRARQLDFNLAQVFIAENELKKALPRLDDFLKTQPADMQPYELLVDLLGKMQRGSEVVGYLEGYAERDKHNLGLHLLLARQYARNQQRDKAEALYRKLLQEHTTPEVYRGLFTMFKDARQMGLALNDLNDALRVATDDEDRGGDKATAAARARSMLAVLRDDPDMVKALIPIAQQELQQRRQPRVSETWRFLAVLAARTKQLEAAEAMYRQCLNYDNPRGINPRNEQDIYSGMLEVLWDLRKYEEVVRVCDLGIRHARVTTHELFHTQRAMALVRLGRGPEAVEAAEAAVKMARDSTRLRIRRIKVEVLTQVERYQDAEKECQDLLKEFSQPGEIRDIRHTLSHVYSTGKNFPKAEEQLRLVLDADPRDATANNDLGYIMADRGRNLEEAEQLIRRAIELDREARKSSQSVTVEEDQENAAFLDSLGWVLFRRGQLDEARKWLEKSAGLSGGASDPVVWDHLGDVYFRLNEATRALTAWQKAAELYEKEKRRKMDDQYRELKNKLKLLERETHRGQ